MNRAVGPPTMALTSEPSVAAGRTIVAESVDQIAGGLVLWLGGRDRREHGGVSVGVDLRRGHRPHAGVGGHGRSDLLEGCEIRVGAEVDHDEQRSVEPVAKAFR